mmetsp:Transcript_105011/g.203362  ORF Transcript_105011/g.203362 Transcript_105011/m.203362 type:complete len:437 (-) Transcript_105011:96-1406(-)
MSVVARLVECAMPLFYLLVLCPFDVVASHVIKVGGPLQTTGHGFHGRKVLELWKDWASSPANKLGFTVELHIQPFFTSTMAKKMATQMTDPEVCKSGVCVDVLVCPYGSNSAYAAVEGVPEGSNVPIMVWGGAAENIFRVACKHKRCFGTLATASNYFIGGLSNLRATDQSPDPLSIALIGNPAYKFSVSAIDGVRQWLREAKGFHPPIVKQFTGTGIASAGSLSPSDEAAVDEVIKNKTDVVVMAGGDTSGDVVQVVLRLANQTDYMPKAIFAKNAITHESQDLFRSLGHLGYQECLLMPTQWAAIRGLKDNIVGWDPESFQKDLGIGYITYHAVSAAAAVISITHAIQKWSPTDWTHLADQLAKVDIQTLYGRVRFNKDGTLNAHSKPIYVRQRQGTTSPIIYPLAQRTSGLEFPLSKCSGWNGKNATEVSMMV